MGGQTHSLASPILQNTLVTVKNMRRVLEVHPSSSSFPSGEEATVQRLILRPVEKRWLAPVI